MRNDKFWYWKWNQKHFYAIWFRNLGNGLVTQIINHCDTYRQAIQSVENATNSLLNPHTLSGQRRLENGCTVEMTKITGNRYEYCHACGNCVCGRMGSIGDQRQLLPFGQSFRCDCI